MYFGAWSLLRRSHYRRVHRLRSDDWVLNAHGTWMLLVGSALLTAAARGTTSEPEVRLLGLGSALGLSANDVVGVVRREIAPIYYSDLAWEAAIAALWPLATRSRRP